MRLLGLDITRSRGGGIVPVEKVLSPVDSTRGWTRILESFTGAWQRNIEVNQDSVLSFHAIFACATLIASDISKLRIKLVEKRDDIWVETANSAYSPVLRSPNPYQNRIQFFESWIISKLLKGNTYVLKGRYANGLVRRLYILDPNRTKPLVSDDGQVFYEVQADNLCGITGPIIVPAREIIHDRMNTLFHPLVGISPIFANALAATQGIRIQNNSARFFGNNAQPGGILTASGTIPDDVADRLKANWEENFTGENYGRVAVLGGGLAFEKLAMTAQEGQMIEQLKWTAEVVCSTFHVPPYKIGIGVMPTYNNIQALNVEYYSQCLQVLMEAVELCLDEGLGIGEGVGPGAILGTEFDTDNLLRMDSVTLADVTDKLRNTETPDESRRRWSLPPTPGGNVVYRQQQDFSLAALAKRDAQPDPFTTSKPPEAPAAPPAPAQDNANAGNQRRALAAQTADTADRIADSLLRRAFELGLAA